MSKLKRILFLLGAILLFVLIFVYDVARLTASLDFSGAEYIRDAAITASFLLLYFYIRGGKLEKALAIPKNIGKLLAYAVVVLFLLGLVLVSGVSSVLQSEDVPAHQAAIAGLLYLILSISLGMFSASTLLTIRDLILYKRKKGTKRNFIIFLVLLFANNLVVLPVLPAEGKFVASMVFPLVVIMIVVNSFKQNWIVYLSRREKIYSIAYGALLFIAFVLINFLANRSPIDQSLANFFQPLQNFIQLNSIFGAVYFGMAFVSALFHLPTAEVYERKQSELTSLHNLSRLVTQVFDFPDLVNTVTSMTLEVVGAKSAWLELIKGKRNDGQVLVEVVALKNISREQIEAITVDTDLSLRQLVLDSKRPLLIDDVANDRRTKHIKKLNISIGSLISVPLLSHNEIIGILHATKDFQYGFDQDDIDVLTTFADHVGIAIENSKLIAKSLERERFQQEIMVAQQMQKRLLPQKVPHYDEIDIAALSEPSLEVGGDYYDFVVLDSHRVGIVIGDVSGKGVSAAFYMAEVKGIFQSLSKLCASPRELVMRANQALMDSLERRAFISLLYAIVDISKAQMTLARAGHCPMVYISGNSSGLIRPTGIGLGLTNDQLFDDSTQETTLNLKKGDICVFYTDGVNESRNQNGDEFGFDRLVEATTRSRMESAERIKENILNEIRNYTGNSSYEDDMTLVVIKWLGT